MAEIVNNGIRLLCNCGACVRRKNRAATRRYREGLSEAQREERRAKDRVRHRVAFERETPEDRTHRLTRQKKWATANRPRWISDRNAKRGAPSSPLHIQILVGDPCSYCGAPADGVDHIDPIAYGGSGDWENLAAACGKCNHDKLTLPLLLFLLVRSGTVLPNRPARHTARYRLCEPTPIDRFLTTA